MLGWFLVLPLVAIALARTKRVGRIVGVLAAVLVAVTLLATARNWVVARQFVQAQAAFEAALALDERMAEAHNNLAYALRMQGRHNFAASLAHYNRAVELKPDLAQAYMYRGVLFVQQGDKPKAQQDLERLRRLDARLAADLERVIQGADAGSERGGVAAQYE